MFTIFLTSEYFITDEENTCMSERIKPAYLLCRDYTKKEEEFVEGGTLFVVLETSTH